MALGKATTEILICSTLSVVSLQPPQALALQSGEALFSASSSFSVSGSILISVYILYYYYTILIESNILICNQSALTAVPWWCVFVITANNNVYITNLNLTE